MGGQPEFTRQQVRTMLANLQRLVLNRRDARFDPGSDSVTLGDGGIHMDVLAEEGFTSATDFFGWDKSAEELGL